VRIARAHLARFIEVHVEVMIGLKNAFSGKNNEGGTMATLLRAKNKFKRKSRREQWMQYGAKFVHHRAFMYEHWVEMDEETKVVLESEAFDFDNVPADNLRQRLRFGQEEWQDCNSNGELMMGVGHAQDFFDNAARGIAESAAINMPVHVGWDHMDGREVERLKYLAEQEAVKREQHKAMDLLKKKIQPWHPCEDSNQLVLVPHKSARRAKAKMAEDYLSLQCLHPYALVRDLVRCSFVCTSADKVLQVFAAVRDEPTWTVMFVKNRFRGPSPANYRDLLVYVAMDVPAGESERHPGQPPEPVTRRVLGEVQIHHIDMLRASRAENGMHLFQYFRAYFGSATMSTIPVLVKLKILKKMDQVATTPADLENFLENFLMSGGRATKELARIWAFQMLLNKVSEYDLAERMLRHIIMLLREKGEAAEKDLSFALGTLTSLCIQRRQYEKAVPLAGEALALSEKHRGRKHLDTCLLMDTNAILKECLQQREEAMALYQEVLATRLQLLPTSDARIMNSHRHVAELSQDMRDFHASEVRVRILPPPHPPRPISVPQYSNPLSASCASLTVTITGALSDTGRSGEGGTRTTQPRIR
jgi:tetratricopeptide (TPR) repeat protein